MLGLGLGLGGCDLVTITVILAPISLRLSYSFIRSLFIHLLKSDNWTNKNVCVKMAHSKYCCTKKRKGE